MKKIFSPLTTLFRRGRTYLLLLFIPALVLAFFAVERLVPPENGYWTSYVPLDDRIPFAPVFVYPYCLWYPYLLFTGLALLRDWDSLNKYLGFLTAAFSLCLVFYLLFPNGQNLRPEALSGDKLCTRLLSHIYALDTNTNVFPSMHVVGCFAAAGAAFRFQKLRRWRWSSAALALLICASTVLVKQHSILDVFGGAALGAALYPVFYGSLHKKRISAPASPFGIGPKSQRESS